jgi:hypothetical protein
MKFTCSNCGKDLKTWENVFVQLQIPNRGFVEIQAYLSQSAKFFCSDCIKILHERAK